MPSIRGVATAAANNVIQGDGVAQFSGRRWVEVHAVQIRTGGSGAPVETVVDPVVDVEYANGQVTMSKGPIPVIAPLGDSTIATAMLTQFNIGFTEATRIFQGWVQGTPEAEQVLKIGAPANNTSVYWSFEHRAQP